MARAVSLLGCVAESDDGYTLAELARRTGMVPSTALRVLRTLCQGGLLARPDGSDRYIRGPALLALAQRSYLAADLGRAQAILDGLLDRLGESVVLLGRDAGCAVVVLRASSAGPLRYELPLAVRSPLHTTAGGKVLLAASGPSLADVETLIGPGGRLEARTPSSRTDPASLVDHLVAVATQGWAIDDQEHDLGIRSVAVPVSGAPVRVALATHGPAVRIRDEYVEGIVQELRLAANDLVSTGALDALAATAPWLAADSIASDANL